MSSRGRGPALPGLLLGAMLGACAPRAPATAVTRPEHFGKSEAALDGRRFLHAPRDTQVVAVDAGISGDRIAALVDVPADSCAVLIARGTDSIEDLDLLAYGEDGAVLGADEAADKTPALLICPPHPRRVYVAARIAAGHGIVALGVERIEPRDAARAAAAFHTRNRPGEAGTRPSNWPELDERMSEYRRRIGGQWQDVRRVALPLDARLPTRVSAEVAAHRCLHALVMPGDDVSHLDVVLLDSTGRIAGRASAAGRDRSLIVCSAEPSAVTLEVRPQSGIGLALLALSQSVLGTESEIEAKVLRFDLYPSGDLRETRQTHAERLERFGYARAKLLGQGELGLGQLSSLLLSLPRGCARLDVIGAEPLRGMDARLWNGDGHLIAVAENAPQAALFACTQGGPARLDAEALVRAGPYAVELRVENGTPDVLNDHPLAAGRLIERMIERGIIKNATQVGKVSALALSAERMQSLDFNVPVGRCMEVTLALGEGATGAEVRLVAEDQTSELGLGRGTHVASARACALERPAATLRLRAELRVRSGQGEALTASRLLSPVP